MDFILTKALPYLIATQSGETSVLISPKTSVKDFSTRSKWRFFFCRMISTPNKNWISFRISLWIKCNGIEKYLKCKAQRFCLAEPSGFICMSFFNPKVSLQAIVRPQWRNPKAPVGHCYSWNEDATKKTCNCNSNVFSCQTRIQFSQECLSGNNDVNKFIIT